MRTISLCSVVATLCVLTSAYGQGRSLSLSQTIPLPSVQGGFNHMSADAARHRLIAAAPTNSTLEIIDLNTGRPWRSLEGPKPNAARFAPEFNQLYVTRGQSVYIYDGATLDLIASVDLHSNLDELQYEPRAKELYVGCMTDGKTAIAILGLPEGKLVGEIRLPAKPQGFIVEQRGTRIFANLPTLHQVAIIDRERRTVLDPWPVPEPQGNTPIALDEAHHRLFVGCRQPARLVVFETTTGKRVADVAIGGDTDDLFYDAARRRIYVSCGEGFVDVIDQLDADRYRMRERISTVPGARTSTFSPDLNALFLGVPRRGQQPAEIRVFLAKE